MRYPEFHYHFQWQFKASPETLWPLVADTNRFGFDTALPAVHRQSARGERLANARQFLNFRRFKFIPFEWEEGPFEWVRPHRFGVNRRYRAGLLDSFRVLVELEPRAAGGTQLHYHIWMRPRNPLGILAIPIQVFVFCWPFFNLAYRRYDEVTSSGQTRLDLPAPVHFSQGGRRRLTTLSDTLIEQGADPQLVNRLVKTLQQLDDFEVSQLRPYILADLWGVPRRDVLELFLWATRVGLLDFQWQVLCPLCRGPQERNTSLGGIQSQVHCDTCNIDYTANFDRSVELTFRPNPSVRDLAVGEYCIGSPTRTPHVVAQQLMGPDNERSVSLALEAGRYRLRALELPGGQYLTVSPEGADQASCRATPAGWSDDEPLVSEHPTLHFKNATEREQLFILERMAWGDQATTAADVTSLQLFRDLFAHEALRPGERFSVGNLTILFTDLRGSTKLYREIGDAPAFGKVMSHFDILREEIANEDGALVKTIGDAVMGVFRQPVAGVRAMLRAQERLAASNPADGPPLRLKAGLHSGPAIAVTLNDRLDYFGSTVNLAARLEGLSSGDDVIVSAAVRHDPIIDQLIVTGELRAESFVAHLKGFDQEEFELWRVSRAMPALIAAQQEAAVLLAGRE